MTAERGDRQDRRTARPTLTGAERGPRGRGASRRSPSASDSPASGRASWTTRSSPTTSSPASAWRTSSTPGARHLDHAAPPLPAGARGRPDRRPRPPGSACPRSCSGTATVPLAYLVGMRDGGPRRGAARGRAARPQPDGGLVRRRGARLRDAHLPSSCSRPTRCSAPSTPSGVRGPGGRCSWSPRPASSTRTTPASSCSAPRSPGPFGRASRGATARASGELAGATALIVLAYLPWVPAYQDQHDNQVGILAINFLHPLNSHTAWENVVKLLVGQPFEPWDDLLGAPGLVLLGIGLAALAVGLVARAGEDGPPRLKLPRPTGTAPRGGARGCHPARRCCCTGSSTRASTRRATCSPRCRACACFSGAGIAAVRPPFRARGGDRHRRGRRARLRAGAERRAQAPAVRPHGRVPRPRGGPARRRAAPPGRPRAVRAQPRAAQPRAGHASPPPVPRDGRGGRHGPLPADAPPGGATPTAVRGGGARARRARVGAAANGSARGFRLLSERSFEGFAPIRVAEYAAGPRGWRREPPARARASSRGSCWCSRPSRWWRPCPCSC